MVIQVVTKDERSQVLNKELEVLCFDRMLGPGNSVHVAVCACIRLQH